MPRSQIGAGLQREECILMYSKLRHPVRAIRRSFGTPGVIIAVIALIAALGGTAIASGGLSGAEKKLIKKESEKSAKKFAKAGPQGAPGAPGAKGTNGTNGKDGSAGTDGKSVEVLAGAAGCGTPGGSTVRVKGEPGTAQEVCNGDEGSPWTAGGVLPPEKTETGLIGGRGTSASLIPISFSIPLPAALDTSHVKIVNVGDVVPAECAGGTVANPKAAPGYLCAYNSAFSEVFETETPAKLISVFNPVASNAGAATTGALISTQAGEPFDTMGATYAVTAPAAP